MEPVAVAGGLAFDHLATGEESTCDVVGDGVVHRWGSNRAGWLGDGTTEPHLEPAPVTPPS